MKGEHEELRKSIAALEGVEGWRREAEQLEMVGMAGGWGVCGGWQWERE